MRFFLLTCLLYYLQEPCTLFFCTIHPAHSAKQAIQKSTIYHTLVLLASSYFCCLLHVIRSVHNNIFLFLLTIILRFHAIALLICLVVHTYLYTYVLQLTQPSILYPICIYLSYVTLYSTLFSYITLSYSDHI